MRERPDFRPTSARGNLRMRMHSEHSAMLSSPRRSKRRRRRIEQRGLKLELDELEQLDTAAVAPEDHAKDGTGIGQVWQAATDVLCDWVESHPRWVAGRGRCLELGAGVGVVGPGRQPALGLSSLRRHRIPLLRLDYVPLRLRVRSHVQRPRAKGCVQSRI